MRHSIKYLRQAMLAAVVMIGGLCFAPSASQASSICLVPTGTTSCSPGPVTATQGVNLALDVFASLDPGISVSAFFFDLTWPSASFDLLSAVDGGFVGACASATPCFNASEFPGEVFVSFFDDTGSHSAAGSGVLATLTLKPLLTGNVGFSFSLVGFDDEEGLPIFIDDNGNPTLSGQGLTFDVGSPTAPTPVPEPATLLLLGSGLAGAVLRRRRSKRVTS